MIGSHFVQNKRINERTGDVYNTGEILSSIIAFLNSMLTMIQLTPSIQALIKSKIVGAKVFEIIDRVPHIRDMPDAQYNVELNSEIKFENISFKYPSAKPGSRCILKNVNFSIKANETTAIVGPSGSGKSTIVQMIERFYAPLEGEIYFDTTNIKKIGLQALRESIGYVS
jgi:ABC-type multidrug transport system fused ATPase/permease subunit